MLMDDATGDGGSLNFHPNIEAPQAYARGTPPMAPGGAGCCVQKVSIQMADSITLSHTGTASVTIDFDVTTRGWSRIFNVPEDLPPTPFSDFESVVRGFESPRAHQRILY
jgi:hypothetical protein